MSTHYQQLTQAQRYQIQAFRACGLTLREIATRIGTHASTVSRELRRNVAADQSYQADEAQGLMHQRRIVAAKASKYTEALWDRVTALLEHGVTPEAAAGRLQRESYELSVSHEWIYRQLDLDKRNGGELYKHLPRKKKKYRKRYGSHDRRGCIPNRVSITERPTIVDDRTRIGDWEGDTVHGQDGSLVTLVDRKSGLLLMGRVRRRTAKAVCKEIIRLLKGHVCHTLTLDNGREFMHHEKIAKRLSIKVYFADPYASWQRGCNENANGLIRRYLPKGSSFKKASIAFLSTLMARINLWPRKRLDYETPYEAYYGVSVALIP